MKANSAYASKLSPNTKRGINTIFNHFRDKPARENDNFHIQTAKTPEEITKLLEVGFEYVLEKDGYVFFRKRK